MKEHFLRYIWLTGGCLSLGFAILGVVLPLLPTTPLVILAAYCFSKSSPRLYRWLHENRMFGPLLHDWEQHGVIKTKSKIIATVAIVLLFSVSICLTRLALVLNIILVTIAISILYYIWSRPSSIHSPLNEAEHS